MNGSKSFLFIGGLLAVLTVSACSQDDSSATVQVADAKAFSPANMDALGVNENGKGMKVGDHATAVILKDKNGGEYALESAWADKPALVIFYRGGWCPYCNGQVKELTDEYPKFEAAGVQPVLISVDSPDKSAMVEAKYSIPFPVLSDSNLTAHKAFNVVLGVDEATQTLYKSYGIDLKQWSGQDHGTIAIASAFIIDTRGHIVFSHAPADFKTRPNAEQLLGLIGNLEL